MSTIRQALFDARTRLTESETASLDARRLLCFVLKVEQATLFTTPERILTPEEYETFNRLVEQRITGEPIAYIIGTQGFYDLVLDVTPDVLIPRPETELLLEVAFDHVPIDSSAVVADIGTGSGALAVAFKVHRLVATVYGIDASTKALAVARTNANKYQAEVTFIQGDLATPLIEQGIKVDLLIANLPYIAKDELPALDVGRWEPHLALTDDADGLQLIKQLLIQVPEVCTDQAVILLEIGATQADEVCQFVADTLSPRLIQVKQDYSGNDRIVQIQR